MELISPSIEQVKGSIGIKLILMFNLVINISGGIMHFGLLLVTVKNRKFHSTCQLLLGFNSFGVITAYFLVLAPLTVICSPSLHPTLRQCFYIQFIFLFSNFHFFSLMVSIGLDRLLSAFWPLWYTSREDRRYLFYLLFLSILFPLFIIWIAFTNMMNEPNAEKSCTIGELLGQQTPFVGLCCLFCIVVSVSCYSIVWIRIKIDTHNGIIGGVAAQRRSSIFRALCVILSVQVCGWVLGQLIYAFIYFDSQLFSPLTRWKATLLVLCFVSFVAALDVPVLLYTSAEYRLAFLHEFPQFFKIVGLNELASSNGAAVVPLGRMTTVVSS